MMPKGTRILVCREPQDMRRSFDGLALATREVLGEVGRSSQRQLWCQVVSHKN